jgi:hypothetical protein
MRAETEHLPSLLALLEAGWLARYDAERCVVVMGHPTCGEKALGRDFGPLMAGLINRLQETPDTGTAAVTLLGVREIVLAGFEPSHTHGHPVFIRKFPCEVLGDKGFWSELHVLEADDGWHAELWDVDERESDILARAAFPRVLRTVAELHALVDVLGGPQT